MLFKLLKACQQVHVDMEEEEEVSCRISVFKWNFLFCLGKMMDDYDDDGLMQLFILLYFIAANQIQFRQCMVSHIMC